ncbi:MAG: pyruvate kinase [Cyclobacteriaceae bacterium]|nr:pyruvate kinase [Cyclobacteriaceae bacterium]
MAFNAEGLRAIHDQISQIIHKAELMEDAHMQIIESVHPAYNISARNLIHYLAFRSYDIDVLQEQLRGMGLPSLTHIEGHVMESLLSIKTIINHLLGNLVVEFKDGVVTSDQGKSLFSRNTEALFGRISKKRRTRIMVTLPSIAAVDKKYVKRLMKAGMNSARINCAHDDTVAWGKMVSSLREQAAKLEKDCRVMMDLGGPKLRTGAVLQGPKVLRIKPKRNAVGVVVTAARVWLAPPEVGPPDETADAILPIPEQFFRKLEIGSIISFKDTRGKSRQISIFRRESGGIWGLCRESAYITTGTEMKVIKHKKTGVEAILAGEIVPQEQFLLLQTGDLLILRRDPSPGENARMDESGELVHPAFISCTMPEILQYIKINQPIFFDDGKIEGKVEKVLPEEVHVRIVHAKDSGSKLRADKGINLPETDLPISGLTERDKEDLAFVVTHADGVNYSFVNDARDVEMLLEEIQKHQGNLGIILKIETQKAFKNLPEIILTAMRSYPVGVMIARGDLAIETGWKNFATIQEEILRICEAAFIPDVWATQVLESMAKNGVPSRAEITDASRAQRAACVMLNKGVYIEKTVKLLDRIFIEMQRYQKKRETLLPKLAEAESLRLSR